MYVNDPIADMLTRVRNANMIYSDSVDVPASKMKLAIARILKEEGYIRNFKTITDPKKPYAGDLAVYPRNCCWRVELTFRTIPSVATGKFFRSVFQ